MTLKKRKLITGWCFILPVVILLLAFSFYPMLRAVWISLQRGPVRNLQWYGAGNYLRIFKDKVFWQTLRNNFTYMIFVVPISLTLALIIASVLNIRDLRFRSLFRTLIFLPCATSLVAYSMIFGAMFADYGLINSMLSAIGLPEVGWMSRAVPARIVMIIALIWRWTGYYMVFYQSGLQNIDYQIYEAAKIDGANSRHVLFKITIPLLKPTILFTMIMAVNSCLQLTDESLNLTNGGPGNATMTMAHYIYNLTFIQNPNFGYAASISIVILVMTAILAIVQMKVGDSRD